MYVKEVFDKFDQNRKNQFLQNTVQHKCEYPTSRCRLAQQLWTLTHILDEWSKPLDCETKPRNKIPSDIQVKIDANFRSTKWLTVGKRGHPSAEADMLTFVLPTEYWKNKNFKGFVLGFGC